MDKAILEQQEIIKELTSAFVQEITSSGYRTIDRFGLEKFLRSLSERIQDQCKDHLHRLSVETAKEIRKMLRASSSAGVEDAKKIKNLENEILELRTQLERYAHALTERDNNLRDFYKEREEFNLLREKSERMAANMEQLLLASEKYETRSKEYKMQIAALENKIVELQQQYSAQIEALKDETALKELEIGLKEEKKTEE